MAKSKEDKARAKLKALQDQMTDWTSVLQYVEARTGISAEALGEAVEETAETLEYDERAVKALVVVVAKGERHTDDAGIFGADDSAVQSAYRQKVLAAVGDDDEARGTYSTFGSLTVGKRRTWVDDEASGKRVMRLDDEAQALGKLNSMDAIGRALDQRGVLHKAFAKRRGASYWRLGAGKRVDVSGITLD